ncbi:predicted protein [Aspergillus terreus NIH2624]|uniref:Sex determining protein n=1 Tax=Aspergillus terreus (strain NIH 2624 / FGSC A1156) TaxID=341663 RepID=Q0CRE6_ASPTN|nr:uncharacterized protein ATEG_03738 [Aspergillus terreus NIH2624]EAU35540.1 predicted protein [Aspergillus terreus NIH2624]
MYSWHGASSHASTPALPPLGGPRLDSAASTASQQPQQPSYQMPQLRWLPSMISRTPNGPHGLPLSPNLRMSGTPVPASTAPHSAPSTTTTTSTHHPQTHPAVAVVIDAHNSLPSSSASDQSDHPAARDALPDTEHASASASAPSNNTTSDAAPTNPEDDDDLTASGLADLPATADGTADSDTPRKHGKRLTTKEEVSLFEICNRHAADFGQRSNLCKWWMTVTEEFTRDQGHPYSWHSVRRRVEAMTKQRIKFLDDLREKGGADAVTAADDAANPRWRAAIDAWIPTWQRWEQAEAQRIEKRDSRRPRKRRASEWEGGSPAVSVPGAPAAPASGPAPATAGWETPSVTGTPRSASVSVPAQVQASQQSAIRLPPGFENMFSNQPSATPAPPVFASPPPPAPATPGAKENNSVMSAVLETLGKLNRHLDAAGSEPRSSPIVSSVASNPQNVWSGDTRAGNGDEAASSVLSAAVVDRLKQEIRQEMRNEWQAALEKDRAALEEKLDSVQRTQEMILEMLRQEPA